MDELEKYYQYLRSKGADVPNSYQSFRNTLSDDKSARQYHQYLLKNNFDAPENYDSFAKTFGLSTTTKEPTFTQPTTTQKTNLRVATQEEFDKYILPTMSQEDKDRIAMAKQQHEFQRQKEEEERQFPTVYKNTLKQSQALIDKTLNESGAVIDKYVHGKILKDYLDKKREQQENPNLSLKEKLGAYMPSGTSALINPEYEKLYETKKKETLGNADEVLNLIVKDKKVKNPEEAKKLDASIYMLKNQELANQTGQHKLLLKNASEIQKGNLVQIGGQAIKPVDALEAIFEGVKHKNETFDLYNIIQSGDREKLKAVLNQKMKPSLYPAKAAVGWLPKITESLGGMPLGTVVAGGIGGLAGSYIGMPQLGRVTAMAVGAQQFGDMEHAAEVQRVYAEVKNQYPNLSDDEALDMALAAGDRAHVVGAVTGAAFGALPSTKLLPISKSLGMQKVVTNVMKNIGKESLLAGGVAGLGAAGQIAKNVSAQGLGIDRDTMEGVPEATSMMLFMHVGARLAAGATKGFKNLTVKDKKTVQLQMAKIEPEQVKAIYDEQVEGGITTEAEANKAKKEINEIREVDSKIPKDVTDESRIKIMDLIEKRDKLKEEMETLHESFKTEDKKERLKKYDEDIVALSKDKVKPTEAQKIVNKAADEGILSDMNEIMAKSDPEGFVKMIADQVHEITESGEAVSGGSPEQAVRDQYGDALVDAAIKLYPKEQPKKSAVSIILPDEIKEHKTITIKPNTDAIQERSAETVSMGEASRDSETMVAGGKTEKTAEGESVAPPTKEEGELTGITHEEMDKTARQMGWDEYQQSPEKIPEWDEQANKRINENPKAIPDLLDKLRNGDMPDHVEQRMMIRYVADLKAKVEKNPSNANLTALKRAMDLSNIVGGRLVAKSLVARKGLTPVEETLSDAYMREMEASMTDTLTEAQKIKTKAEFEEIQKVKAEYEKKLADQAAKFAEEKAAAAVKKAASTKPKTNKTQEELAKEREDIVKSIKEKWNKSKSDTIIIDGKEVKIQHSGFSPSVEKLMEIAPDVIKLMKNLAEDLTIELKDVIKNIHGSLKDGIPEITEKDIHNIIAGDYNKKKPDKTATAIRVMDLKTEAKLINRLEELVSGEPPKTEKARRAKNKEITKLREQIKTYKKEETEAGKFFGESDKGNKRLEELQDELERVQFRRKKEQPEKGTPAEKEISENEQKLLTEIDSEQKRWQAEKESATTAKKEYRTLETERNRQVERVQTLKEKLKDLEGGNLPATQKKTFKPDTPEIEKLKTEVKAAEKTLRETKATEGRITKMEAELQRLKDRKEKEPKEIKKKELTEKEIELKRQIKEERDLFDAEQREQDTFYKEELSEEGKQLRVISNRMQAQIKNLEEQLRTGKFEKEKKTPIILDKETLKVKDKLIELQNKRKLRLMEEEYNNRTQLQKGTDHVIRGIDAVRGLQTNPDLSFMGRQGWKFFLTHPIKGSQVFWEGFKQAASEARYDRWLYDIHNSELWPMIEKSGLAVLDPASLNVSKLEEQYRGAALIHRIPILRNIVKPSERAFTSMANMARVEWFLEGVRAMQKQGKTFENSPAEYKGWASVVNNLTGRGGLGPLEQAANGLAIPFWSPRLVASNINLLNPYYYAKIPGQARIMLIKNMAQYVVTNLALLAAAKAMGLDVDFDPRSSDFLKLKVGNTRYDITGGSAQYIRVLAQIFSGSREDAKSGKVYDMRPDDVVRTGTNFLRSKAAPVPGFIADAIVGKNVVGEDVNWSDAYKLLIPMLSQDIRDAAKEEGADQAAVTGLASFLGIGAQTYEPKTKKKKVVNE